MKSLYYIFLTVFLCCLLAITVRQIVFVANFERVDNDQKITNTAYIFSSLFPTTDTSDMVDLSPNFLIDFKSLLIKYQTCEMDCISAYWNDSIYDGKLENYYSHHFSPKLIGAFGNNATLLNTELEIDNNAKHYKILIDAMGSKIPVTFTVQEFHEQNILVESKGLDKLLSILCR